MAGQVRTALMTLVSLLVALGAATSVAAMNATLASATLASTTSAVSTASAAVPSVPLPAYSPQGADTCLNCHFEPNIMAIFRTAHARPGDPRGPFGHGGLQCEACHGPGGAHVRARGRQPAGIVDFDPQAQTSPQRQNHMCLTCHQSDAAHDWAASAHAANDVACADCHQLHQADDPVQSVATQIDVCGKCHVSERLAVFKPSRHPLRDGTMDCTSCHSPHGSSGPASLVGATVNDTCTTCHAEFRGPFLWEHQPVTENCDNCHEPHGTVQPTLLKERPPFLCQQCHEAAGHPSAPQTPGGLPGGMPSPLLLVGACVNCHSQVHGSNDPSGQDLMR